MFRKRLEFSFLRYIFTQASERLRNLLALKVEQLEVESSIKLETTSVLFILSECSLSIDNACWRVTRVDNIYPVENEILFPLCR